MGVSMRAWPGPRITTDVYGRKLVDGAPYYGGVRVPPMPHRTALTDRTTGEVKVLSHNEAADTVELVDVNARWPDVHTYGPHEGPYSEGWRLYLDDGTLAFEQDLASINSANGLILTRRAFARTVLQLTPDTAGSVVYTPYTL